MGEIVRQKPGALRQPVRSRRSEQRGSLFDPEAGFEFGAAGEIQNKFIVGENGEVGAVALTASSEAQRSVAADGDFVGLGAGEAFDSELLVPGQKRLVGAFGRKAPDLAKEQPGGRLARSGGWPGMA